MHRVRRVLDVEIIPSFFYHISDEESASLPEEKNISCLNTSKIVFLCYVKILLSIYNSHLLILFHLPRTKRSVQE